VIVVGLRFKWYTQYVNIVFFISNSGTVLNEWQITGEGPFNLTDEGGKASF
jgi:hypothetical protein